MPMRTAEVSLNGEILAIYEVRWHDSDEAPTDEWIRHWATDVATDEFKLEEAAIGGLELSLGPPPKVP